MASYQIAPAFWTPAGSQRCSILPAMLLPAGKRRVRSRQARASRPLARRRCNWDRAQARRGRDRGGGLHQQLNVEEAALFLGTTKGQLYNLLNRREIPYVRWGKRGKRFRRIDLIAWQEDRKRPALS